MYILWKWSTILLGLQVLGGAVTYWITGTPSAAAVAALFFTPLVLVVITFVTNRMTFSLDSEVGFGLSASALISGLFLFRGSVISTVWVFVSVAVILFITLGVILKVREETKEDTSFMLMFFVSLPFGIGAVFGLVSLMCTMIALFIPPCLQRRKLSH